jgi:hypothetical protein
MKKKRKEPAPRIYTQPIKRIRISKIDAAETLLSLSEMEPANSPQTNNSDRLFDENSSPHVSSDSDCLKEKDAVVQTNITLEHIKTYSTECLISTTEMERCLFMKNVANDTLHYTGKINKIISVFLFHTMPESVEQIA